MINNGLAPFVRLPLHFALYSGPRGVMFGERLRMGESLLPPALMCAGFACLAAWLICHGLAALRTWRIRRETRAIEAQIDGGGQAPASAPLALARSYLRVRLLGILGNFLLAAGLGGVLLSRILETF
jgi:hypothetical protein